MGLGHLVGTSLLRAYMHGYFIHNKLWQKAKTIAAPVDYAAVRKVWSVLIIALLVLNAFICPSWRGNNVAAQS